MNAVQPSPSVFQTGHVGLNVTDIDRSERFYRAVFGFVPMGASNDPERRFLFLGDGDRLLITLWQQSEGRFPTAEPGLHHLSFRVESIEEVRAAEERVRSAGGTLRHGGIVPHREGAQSGGIFFEDPDGIRLEIFAPTGASEGGAPYSDAPTCGFF
ncbi:MAG: VOC family protein [Capsulimonadales bacterium]|nr:VOC family protein [Capsulimonadales bacterium]